MGRFHWLVTPLVAAGLVVVSACGADTAPRQADGKPTTATTTVVQSKEPKKETTKPSAQLGRVNKLNPCSHDTEEGLYAAAGRHVIPTEHTLVPTQEWRECWDLDNRDTMLLTTRIDKPGSTKLYDQLKAELAQEGSSNEPLAASQLPTGVKMAYWYAPPSGKLGLVYYDSHSATYSFTFQHTTRQKLLTFLREMVPVGDLYYAVQYGG